MQWIYLICFILLSAGLLALFGVKPGDFIDALFRSQRKSATLSDELNVLLGTPAKGFFNQDYELKQILKGTGRADRYEAVKRLSLILFAVGAVLALLIGNVYMVPIRGVQLRKHSKAREKRYSFGYAVSFIFACYQILWTFPKSRYLCSRYLPLVCG